MLYSKFGSKLTPVSKSTGAGERVTLHATAEGTADVREYQIADLKADGGSAEIDQIVAGLPLKVVERPPPRRSMPEIPQRQHRQHRQAPPFRRR